jgi:predicted helicase
MKFAKKGDKTSVIYNGKITLRGIPEAAWDYVVNGKAALDWVMERQGVKTDKASGIVNDANDWAIETMGNLVPVGAVSARGHGEPGDAEDRRRATRVAHLGGEGPSRRSTFP